MSDISRTDTSSSNPANVNFWGNGFAIFIALSTLCSIALHAYISSKFFFHSAYSVNDIFFDADPPVIGSHIIAGNLSMVYRHPLLVFVTYSLSVAGAAFSRIVHFNLLIWLGIFRNKNKVIYILPVLLLILEITENCKNLSFMLQKLS